MAPWQTNMPQEIINLAVKKKIEFMRCVALSFSYPHMYVTLLLNFFTLSFFFISDQREQTSVLMTGTQCQFLVLRPGWWCQDWSLGLSTSSVCWPRTNWAQVHSVK